jgi:hypothetical protein
MPLGDEFSVGGVKRRLLSRQSDERLALAAKWVHALATRGDEVVLLSGSAGLGIADDHSDIDLYVFNGGTSEAELDNAMLRDFGLRKVFTARTRRGGSVGRYALDGVLVDIEHLPREALLQTIDAVVLKFDVDPMRQKVLRGLLDAIALHGEAEWQGWCGRLAVYPRQLAVNMIRAHLRFDSLWRLKRRTLLRGDHLAFFGALALFLTHLLGVLAGLNRYYLGAAPGILKWTDLHLRRMQAVPSTASDLIRASLSEPSDTHLMALEYLVRDLFSAIDSTFPEVSTSTARDYLGCAGLSRPLARR